MDDESITHACLDGVMLGEKIIEAAENDAMFRNVPEHFYWDSTRRWATHAKGWLEKWYRAHDLPPDYAGREGEIPVTREQGFMHFRRAQPRNKVAIGPWVSVEDFFRRERPKVSHSTFCNCC